jgi:hypothetical protein
MRRELDEKWTSSYTIPVIQLVVLRQHSLTVMAIYMHAKPGIVRAVSNGVIAAW